MSSDSPMMVSRAAATVLTSTDYIVMPWKDGGGTTREIARWPPADSSITPGSNLAQPSFAWRVSIADIAASCAFSRFEGYDRTLMLLQGSRMTLHVGEQSAIQLTRYASCAFDGEANVRCTLSDGPVKDLNVMTARGRASAITEILRPGPAVQHHAIRGTSLLLHCRDGAVVIALDDGRALTLDDGDTLRVDAASPPLGRFGIATADSITPAVIAIHLALRAEHQNASPDSTAGAR